MLRVILDTNVVISGMILKRGVPFEILEAWRRDVFQWIYSSAQRSELAETLRRPKFARNYDLTDREIGVLLHRLDRRGLQVTPLSAVSVEVRDPDDEVILATALAGSADVLVTGDKDLLELSGEPYLAPLQIVDPATFLTMLGL